MENKRILSASDGASIYFFALIADLIVQLAASAITLLCGEMSDSVSSILNIIFMLFLQLAFFGVLAVYLKKTRVSLTFAPARMSVSGCLIALLVAGVTLCCFILPAQWFAWGLEKLGYNFSGGVSFDTPLEIVLGSLVTVIIAPIVEELVFRGALLGSLVRRMNAVSSVLLSGLCFSLMHMNPEQTVYQFFLGCVCAYLTLCARTVTPAILTHGASNLIALLLSFASEEGGSYALSKPVIAAVVTVVLLFVGAAIIAFAGKALMKKRTRTDARVSLYARLELSVLACREGEEREGLLGRGGFSFMLSAGLVVSAVMWAIVFVAAII